MKESLLQRRTVLKGALAALAAIPVVAVAGRADAAAASPKLDPNDPTAKALGYAVDSAKVDGAKYPAHKPDQKCTNCVQFQGKATDAAGGCNIFPGKQVEGPGWCTAWTKKP
jgi:hypothetical protein